MGYVENMRELLNEEYQDYADAMMYPPIKGLRLNLLKGSPNELEPLLPWKCIPVEWCNEGRTISHSIRPGQYALHSAGIYYLQEPSAMAPAPILQAEPGQKVLDLCAAPGGKTGQLAAAMQGKGILFANEPILSRARVLAENLQRLGVKNAIVTNEYPKKLVERFPRYFHRILVDAPCSGEGMFRRDPMIKERWSEESVRGCAKRQLEILESAYLMLRPGGKIVYSTCTFSTTENEEVCLQFLEKHPMLKPIQIFSYPGWVIGKYGIGMRLYPHRLKGEGQFLAAFYLPEYNEKEEEIFTYGNNHLAKIPNALVDFLKDYSSTISTSLQGLGILRWGRWCYMLPEDCPSLNGLKIVLPGLCLGQDRGDYFIPAHALALSQRRLECYDGKKLDYPSDSLQVMHFLRGESFSIPDELHGWIPISTNGFPLGWIKAVNGRAQNHLPKKERLSGDGSWYYSNM